MVMLNKKQVAEVLEILHSNYPNPECELNYSTPFELMVATILSAQCTDVRVNKVTAELFKKYNKPEDYLKLGETELSELIRSTGFYRNKSRHIIGSAKILYEEYNSQVPETREELIKLPGVGRKTANVILSNAFKKDAIAVDTHVFRVSNRIGIVDETDVFKTELSLMEQIEKSKWSLSHNLLVLHGRRVCKSRRPLCEECDVKKHCVYYNKVR